MHTKMYAKASDGKDYHILHNGDWSGNIIIEDEVDMQIIRVPADVLTFIVGEMVRNYRMSRVEELDSRTLCGLPPLPGPPIGKVG